MATYVARIVYTIGLDDLADECWSEWAEGDDPGSARAVAQYEAEHAEITNFANVPPESARPCDWQISVWEGTRAEGEPVHVAVVREVPLSEDMDPAEGWERVSEGYLTSYGLARYIQHGATFA